MISARVGSVSSAGHQTARRPALGIAVVTIGVKGNDRAFPVQAE